MGENEEKVAANGGEAAAESGGKVAPSFHFVLVHGFGHGAWCWYKLRCLMENSGHKVSCIDLKGSGVDRTDPDTIFTFQDYNQPLLDFLSALPDKEQVVLVGHSAGGFNVTDATYRFPQKIRLVIYVAAAMLKRGLVDQQDFKDGIPDFSDIGELTDVCDLGFGLGTKEPPTSIIIKKEMLRKINYNMSPQEDSTLAAMLVRPGPIRAVTSAQFGESSEDKVDVVDKVPRIYIKTLHDRAVKPEQQESMIKRWPPLDLYVLDSDHSPFFSAPFALFGLLLKAVASL